MTREHGESPASYSCEYKLLLKLSRTIFNSTPLPRCHCKFCLIQLLSYSNFTTFYPLYVLQLTVWDWCWVGLHKTGKLDFLWLFYLGVFWTCRKPINGRYTYEYHWWIQWTGHSGTCFKCLVDTFVHIWN